MSAIVGLARKLKFGGAVHSGSRLMAWCVGNAKEEQGRQSVMINKYAAGAAKIDPLMAASTRPSCSRRTRRRRGLRRAGVRMSVRSFLRDMLDDSPRYARAGREPRPAADAAAADHARQPGVGRILRRRAGTAGDHRADGDADQRGLCLRQSDRRRDLGAAGEHLPAAAGRRARAAAQRRSVVGAERAVPAPLVGRGGLGISRPVAAAARRQHRDHHPQGRAARSPGSSRCIRTA
jgi:hypothetical protein